MQKLIGVRYDERKKFLLDVALKTARKSLTDLLVPKLNEILKQHIHFVDHLLTDAEKKEYGI
jgi:hypothetical protein